MSSQGAIERKLIREIASRKQAELLLEQKSLELYEANQQLHLVLGELQRQTHIDLHKLQFEEQINETLLYFGRAFLSRTLDDGLLASLLERLDTSSALCSSGVFLTLDTVSTVKASQFGCSQTENVESIKPFAEWKEDQLSIPLEVEHEVVGEISVLVVDKDIEADFIVSQIRLIADILCSAINRQIILTSNQQARTRAEESERATKEFVAMINHELRTPLNGLLGSAELLSDTTLDEEQRTFLTNLSHSGELLRHIINDILDFSKMNAGMMELIPSQFAKADLIGMLESVFTNRALDKGIGFIVDCPTTVPAYLIGDFERICQVLINVIGNAIKFTIEGSVNIDIKWKDDKLAVQVKDTGLGIPEEAQALLFDPFVQADLTAKRKFEGTGLGLAICKNLIALMGGDISFTSHLGVGTQFDIMIPLKGAADLEMKPEYHARGSARQLDTLSILVVDDIRMNQVIFNQMMRKISIVPDIASNGLEAIKLVSERDYDIIFMDCRMPEMDGFEATEYLRGQKYSKPIVALTAGTTLEEREKCIQSGMDDILSKPYTAKELKLVIEKWA
ncbi:ATP-binding protein [Vibrio pectenicida]|uniref:histidine kinase n=1 Tax=Vibrio pectenicida TaxID=62763 RepID=A0A3R9L426_9VIBR|nr:ATP-binding protein [Vibrio pectenicida]RSD32569.1 response regulator [Vibrio pectenicida]